MTTTIRSGKATSFGWLRRPELDRHAYVPNVEQTARSLFGIQLSFIWLPALCYAIAVVPVLFYHRYEQLEPQIRLDLEQRRAVAAAMSSST